MVVRNALIITDDNSVLSMGVNELKSFSGNTVFYLPRLTPEVRKQLAGVTGWSGNIDAATPNLCRPLVDEKLV